MKTKRKQWWQKVALTACGGGVLVGGLFGFVRATAQPEKQLVAPAVEQAVWVRSPTTSAPSASAPSVSEVERTASEPEIITPVGGVLPIPVPDVSKPVAATEPLMPLLPPLPSAPIALPVAPVANDKPLVPLLPVDAPKFPAAPSAADLKPLPVPQFPQLSGNAALPPKPTTVAPLVPVLPQPTVIAPPAKPAEAMQPVLPNKPDSRLKTTVPSNTLKPTSPVAPAIPILPPGVPSVSTAPVVPVQPWTAGETRGTTVERSKPPVANYGSSEKFIAPTTTVPTPRDTPMLNLKHTAAAAILGGAMLATESANAAPAVPFPPLAATVPVRADAESEKKLREDLDKANEKIKTLEKDVKRLQELLLGRSDDKGFILPSDPGAVSEIKELKNKIADLEKKLNSRTALSPEVKTPEIKPLGLVKVVNEYPVEISIVINEKSYRIAPNTKLEVAVPAGEFSYQLLQTGAASTRSVIKDKETVTLRIK